MRGGGIKQCSNAIGKDRLTKGNATSYEIVNTINKCLKTYNFFFFYIDSSKRVYNCIRTCFFFFN